MSDEHVPIHGKADVAFAGAQLSDAWPFLGSIVVGMVAGSTLGWLAYIGVPALGLAATKAYIKWKEHHLPGYLATLLYRLGVAGYSSAFDRKAKLFIGDSKVVNPGNWQAQALVRANAAGSEASADAALIIDAEPPTVGDDIDQLAA